MNNSFKSNTFARVWKIAEVTCVFKDGGAGNPGYNRPISLLQVLSKVSEGWHTDNLSSSKTITQASKIPK